MFENSNYKKNRRPILPFLVFLLLFFTAWIVWVLAVYPVLVGLGDRTLLYAAANLSLRLFIWVVPVFLYLHFIDHVDPVEYLRLKERWKLGVIVGMGFFLLNFLLSVQAYGVPHPNSESVTWNSVLGTSVLIGFVEEIPFRGFMLRKFQERMSFWSANLFSSVLFLLIHFPGWISLNLLTTRSIVLVFVFGFVMAVLVRYTRSLWSAIIAHSSNDFLAFLIFRL